MNDNKITPAILAAFLVVASLITPAKAQDSLFTESMTAAEKGYAIAEAADRRDDGFESSVAELEMILTNRSGATSRRELRIKTLEVPARDLGDKSMVVFDRPRDVKGTALLTYAKILEPDDQWMFLPALKRVKRISSVNKSGPFMGSEFAFEDMATQELGKFTYSYIGEEACGALTCYVIERIPAYEYSGYTKTVAWIDMEELRSQKVDFYDRKGALLKTLTFSDHRLYLDKFWRAHDLFMINHLTGKTSRLLWGEFEFQTGLDEGDFTQASLRRAD